MKHGLSFLLSRKDRDSKKLHPTLTRFGTAQTCLLKEFLCSGRRDFPQRQILYTVVQTKTSIWQQIQPILGFIHALKHALKRTVSCSFALSKALLKCLFLMEQGNRHQEEASCVWRAEFLADGSRAAAAFTENTCNFTYLGLPFRKHRKRQFTARGKGTVFDNRCQDTVLLNLSSGCCRWMSCWARKRSTLIMKLYQFMTVPEIPCQNTYLYCSAITTCTRTALTCPSPCWATAVPNQVWISSAALWPCAHQEHISLLPRKG